MKTKIVYVLTCSPDGNYIEQALIAIWSARYYNPNAHIVLITDDKTDQLLVGKRGELLNYISEKIVIPFDDEQSSMYFRSRMLKTQVRQIISGDFIFIDCDTVCCKSLEPIDQIDLEVGAAPDDNLSFREDAYYTVTCNLVSKLNCDITREDYYYSSGVIVCKETPNAYNLYDLWHKYWIDGFLNKSIKPDQPAFAKSNIELGHIINVLDIIYNCVLYTQNGALQDAIILHISFSKSSFLYSERVLGIIRNEGLTSWIKTCILDIHATYLPFDYHIKHSSIKQRLQWIVGISKMARIYGKNVSRQYEDWGLEVRIAPIIRWLFSYHFFYSGAILWMISRRITVSKKSNIKANTCSIHTNA